MRFLTKKKNYFFVFHLMIKIIDYQKANQRPNKHQQQIKN